ncbi:MAG TPA: SUMF1/EgtB/PvdO family nonheme iron enzyme, partial [Candidatus Saccharimonadia bacterium]|nr:SUMF1/EgtB/PvdO family nonheme iron enzyme [Candidatus Saccharimonadia bacterium]
IGAGAEGFAYDHERPRHTTWLSPYALAARPVTNAEYAAFVEAGGYREPALWLADGWAQLESERMQAPLYWRRADGGWEQFTVHGFEPLDPAEPVCHVSYYEADAFARWACMRLPTEAEWEHAAARREWNGEFADNDTLHPRALERESFGGNVWEWTSSAYLPYPGFRPLEGAAGEYNAKFMSGQMVLRGGSCATPREHVHPSYRNFFPPHARWQFSGLRLAKDVA